MQLDKIEQLKTIIQPVLDKAGIDLVEFTFRRQGKRFVLRLLVDKQGGINLKECAGLNKEIGFLLEDNNIIEDSYVIEVDSPGLDRPLKTREDFRRHIGEQVRIITRNTKGTTDTIEGNIKAVEEEKILVDKDSSEIDVAFEAIIKGKLIIQL